VSPPLVKRETKAKNYRERGDEEKKFFNKKGVGEKTPGRVGGAGVRNKNNQAPEQPS